MDPTRSFRHTAATTGSTATAWCTPYMRYGVIGPTGVTTRLVEIELPGPRLPHDMAATEHYSILMDLPPVADVEATRQGRHTNLVDAEIPARFGSIPRP